ncbi:Zn(II)2Cys6 transcription factor [Penicillium argentinense]|uniref:Zn(II)2Cys6 transcription factor n=1 Tax=Penicillium argentinense TaxID=1131581 RepID=A0A9W9FPI6_9EURO|nr:Zn(II)2Cys6 transcription factor [Penicillium argentinense]KAJ5103938.1 Zn(II)2Cys6 transcription factor [Penicillium argentinense]
MKPQLVGCDGGSKQAAVGNLQLPQPRPPSTPDVSPHPPFSSSTLRYEILLSPILENSWNGSTLIMSVDSFHAIKRIRQACANCRRKKTKCSGERPVCSHCRRNRLACIWEPYSNTTQRLGDATGSQPLSNSPSNADNELLQRISMIESRLAELSGRDERNGNELVCTRPRTESVLIERSCRNLLCSFGLPASDNLGLNLLPAQPPVMIDYSSYPPTPVLKSVIDTYFQHLHNQPYSYFHESLFRQKLERNELPRCLVLAILASAVRFSSHDYYTGRTREAADAYARECWLAVLGEDLTAEGGLDLSTVQTVNLLAVVDYTGVYIPLAVKITKRPNITNENIAGRVSSGWLKIGLAARISQDLQLMIEPAGYLPYPEQEERRRSFWSAYLIDKLISCARSRPLVILDDDCNVQLPCDEQTFKEGRWKTTNTLSELLDWNSNVTENPSPFALVTLMASIFGRCTRYVHQDRRIEEIPPWDTKSEFSAIKSAMLLLESYSKVGDRPISEIVHETRSDEIGHLIFAHTLFHLCHCLLNHPFLVRLRLKPFGIKAPASFSTRALRSGCDHAKQLLDLLRDSSQSGYEVKSSFYAYCIAIAGGIHSLVSHLEIQTCGQSEHLQYFQRSVDALDGLGRLWTHAANMTVRLREFHNISDQFATTLLRPHPAEDLQPEYESIMWAMIDYGILGADPSQKPLSPQRTTTSNLPSPNSWVLGSELLHTDPTRFDIDNTDISSGLTPTMRLNEVENLLNCSPGADVLM